MKEFYSPFTLKRRVLIQAQAFYPSVIKEETKSILDEITDEFFMKTQLAPITALFQEDNKEDKLFDNNQERTAFNCTSMYNKNFEKTESKHGTTVMRHMTRKNIWKVYHINQRGEGTNIDPQKLWNAGVQMVSQNHSTYDKNILYGNGKFS